MNFIIHKLKYNRVLIRITNKKLKEMDYFIWRSVEDELRWQKKLYVVFHTDSDK